MLIRFCLYGFLKNQRYFEPFWILALREKGLSFTQIGVLLAIEGITMQVLEIPSGAVADLFGRRRSLILAFVAYLLSFFALGMSETYWGLCGAMVVFGAGEAFRTGTHKAMIFAWLRLEGRSDEKTRIYGLTRSWSKYGSAVSALIAAGIVFATSRFSAIFLWSMVPCALSLANLSTYPASIDPPPTSRASMGEVFAHLKSSVLEVFRQPLLRGKVLESMGFQGVFRASKDYLQPALVLAAVLWFGADVSGLADERSAAILVGPVYFVMFLGAGIASQSAHRLSSFAGGDGPAARFLWASITILFVCLAAASWAGVTSAVIGGFMILHVLQNLWRPILTSRIYDEVDEKKGATVLSIESQGQRLATVILAPLFGYLVDISGSFWPAAAVAALLSATLYTRSR